MDLDLSGAVMVFSCNNEEDIHPVLRNRLTKIYFEPPSRADKIEIARAHLVPRALRHANLGEDDVHFTTEMLAMLADLCGSEPGMRGMDRAIERIVNTLNVAIHGSADELRSIDRRALASVACPVTVSRELVDAVVSGDRGSDTSVANLMYA